MVHTRGGGQAVWCFGDKAFVAGIGSAILCGYTFGGAGSIRHRRVAEVNMAEAKNQAKRRTRILDPDASVAFISDGMAKVLSQMPVNAQVIV